MSCVVDEIVDGSILSLLLIAYGKTYLGGIEAKRRSRLTVVHTLREVLTTGSNQRLGTWYW